MAYVILCLILLRIQRWRHMTSLCLLCGAEQSTLYLRVQNRRSSGSKLFLQYLQRSYCKIYCMDGLFDSQHTYLKSIVLTVQVCVCCSGKRHDE